jgi:hypothetical protein
MWTSRFPGGENERMKQLQVYAVFIGIVAAHLIFDLAAIPIAMRFAETGVSLAPAMAGVVVGQIGMLAVYLAWGWGYWLTRWVIYWYLAVLMWYAFATGAAFTGDSFAVTSIEALLAICAAILFVSIPIPYWAVRAIFRRRIELVQYNPQSATWAKRQFSIRQLLMWTGAAATILGISRSAVAREVWLHWPMNTGDFLSILSGMLMVALLCVLLAMPATGASLGNNSPTWPLVIVSAYAVIVVAIEWAVVITMTGDNHWKALAGLNLGVLCDVVACSLLLRHLGYRFTRTHVCRAEAMAPNPARVPYDRITSTRPN